MGYTRPGGLSITGGHTVWDVPDGGNYYFGLMIGSVPSGGKIYNIVSPISGQIQVVAIYTSVGTAGTNEDSPVYLRKNDTTDYLIATMKYDTSPQTLVVTNLQIPIAAGDILTFKETPPNFATNPLQVRKIFTIMMDTA